MRWAFAAFSAFVFACCMSSRTRGRSSPALLEGQMAVDAEVIVVGGGPAGAATASLLAGRGHDVLVLERSRFPREKACAEYLSPGVEDVLRRIGAWDAVAGAPHARPTAMQVLTPRSGFALRYPDGNGCRAALGIDRPTLDAVILDHARHCGAAVQEESHVLGALVESGQVVGVRVRTAGEEREYRCRLVVAADGLQSAVARSLSLDARAWAPRRLGL